jgi:nitroreductase
VAVVSAPVASEKVPQIEQSYSAGAVCLALVNAALAAGWGANWLSGWASHDGGFCAEALGLGPQESIAGFIHIGTETSAPPDRPRPDIEAKTLWLEA